MEFFHVLILGKLLISVFAFTQHEVSTYKEHINDFLNVDKTKITPIDSPNSTVEKEICLKIFEKHGLDSNIQDYPNLRNCSETFREELYEMLCRGDYERPIEVTSKLKCYLQHREHSFLTIAPFKVEEINNDPVILQYHNFLNDEEMEKFKVLAGKNMGISRIISKDGVSVVSTHRKSKTAFLNKGETEEENDEVIQRIADSTMLSMDFSEKLQVVKYETGGYYKSHFDFFPEFLHQSEGNRIATFLIYLNDVEEGGNTVFPMLRLHIRPQKGVGILWYNLLNSGIGDRRMWHGACKVLKGTKWISTKWIREKGQEFKRPCSRQKRMKHVRSMKNTKEG